MTLPGVGINIVCLNASKNVPPFRNMFVSAEKLSARNETTREEDSEYRMASIRILRHVGTTRKDRQMINLRNSGLAWLHLFRQEMFEKRQ
jgi:hypothetical protein